MLNVKLNAALAAIAVVAVSSAADNQAVAAEAIVNFRLTAWKTTHFDDVKKAKTTYDTLRKLKCEVKADQHGGHVDVTYRCPQWRSIALKTHRDAHQWEHWLKQLRFETDHQH